MGSDTPPQQLFLAVLEAAKSLSSESALIVFATNDVIAGLRSQLSCAVFSDVHARIEFYEAADVIAMSAMPLTALRRQRHSSLLLGMRELKAGRLQALISCGHTGVLIAAASISLPMLPGISRPALLTKLPTAKGSLIALDVGGSLSLQSTQYVEFAHLGAAYQQAAGLALPKVGLLNIGKEPNKGPKEIVAAYQSLSALSERYAKEAHPAFIFIGNVEGRDLYKGECDVAVANGFSGNVTLKAGEGLAQLIFGMLLKEVESFSCRTELEDIIDRCRAVFDYERHPGAFVAGVEGLIIKVHGSGSIQSLHQSILAAAREVQGGLIGKLSRLLSKARSEF